MNRVASQRRGGFTLIEIMAAVTVLAIIVVFMANVFANTSKVWKLGNKRVESNNSGRAAIEFVAREISSAMAGGTFELAIDSKAESIYGSSRAESDRIAYVSSAITPQAVVSVPPGSGYEFLQRQIKQSVFAVMSTNGTKGPYFLVHHNMLGCDDAKEILRDLSADWCVEGTYGLLKKKLDINKTSIVAENVRNFEVFVYNQQAVPVPDYKSWVHGPPLFIDVYLEVLAEEDAIRAGLGRTSDEELTRATRRYHTRVFMPNVQGAMRD